MAFTYDVTTDLGKVRFLVADTVDAGHSFTDEEITAILGLEATDGNVFSTAAIILRAGATKAAYIAKVWALGDRRMDKTKIPAELRALAAEYDDKATASAGVEIANLGFDEGRGVDLFGLDRTEYEEFDHDS
jgi:hypothetical protein